MLSLKAGIEDLKQAKTLMSEANHIMSDHISKLKALEEENAKLKGKLELMECVQGPSGYMELPLDADGVPIHIGDKVDIDGEAMTVLGYRLYNGELLLIVKKMESSITFTPKPSDVRHFKYVPPDSWEKLEEDAMQHACSYFGIGSDDTSCDDCPYGSWQTGRICCAATSRSSSSLIISTSILGARRP